MSYLKAFLIGTIVLSTGGLTAQTLEQWKKDISKELSNIRIMCVDNKISEMNSKQIYDYLTTKNNPILTNADTHNYIFKGITYSYEFNFDVQQGSENRYSVKITSVELDKKKEIVQKTVYSKTFYVNPIRKPGAEFKGYNPVSPHNNITQDEYNKINTMKLTNLYCWVFEADHWGVK